MSASHNHPDDNGFKFFNSQGAQDIPPHDEELASYQDDIREVHRMPFQQGVDQGLIQEIPPEVREAYLAINLALGEKAPEGASPIVYTPLCGTGDASVGEVLRRAGYPVALYGPQANYDGTFASVASRLPNPEIPQAAQASLQMPEAQDAVLALSTDPDADRLGAYAKDSQGSWRFLTGNDIATLLTYYQVLDKERGPGKNGVIIKSLVTTRSLEEIARRAGCQSVDDLLVGFKYIAHVLDCLERTGRFRHVQAKPKNLVLACEESHGFLLTEQIRDKDAAGAAIVLCELSAKLEKEGKRLPEYLEQAQVELGNYVNSARSVVMRGIAGMEAMVKLMSSLRAKPFESFGGLPVRGFEDFRDEKLHGPILSKTDFSARNLLLYRLDGAQVVIRPSGTEPKLKIYVDVEGQAFGCKTRQEALQSASRVGAQVFRALLDRAEVKLSDSASELPDYVDIDLKQGFDSEFRKKLEAAAPQLAEKSKEEQMEWLRSELAPYAPGADPLVATRAALIHLCVALAESSENGPVHDFYVGLATALEQ